MAGWLTLFTAARSQTGLLHHRHTSKYENKFNHFNNLEEDTNEVLWCQFSGPLINLLKERENSVTIFTSKKENHGKTYILLPDREGGGGQDWLVIFVDSTTKIQNFYKLQPK
jgi:hypothetical protein